MKTNKTNESVICLVGLSVSRDCFMDETIREKKIKARLKDCFPEIDINVDSLEGMFNLSQVFGEVVTPLAKSYGLMDFVELPLADSIWLNKLFLTKEIDLVVDYVEDHGKERVSYQRHTSFPDWDNVSMHPYHAERAQAFSKALNSMRIKNGLVSKEDI